jgi:hypothetical protein
MIGNSEVISAACGILLLLKKLDEWVTVAKSPSHSMTGLRLLVSAIAVFVS